MQLPYRDESHPGGVKRVFWPKGDAKLKRREFARDAANAVSKKDRRYSREDQRKIIAEKYGEFCERHPQFGE